MKTEIWVGLFFLLGVIIFGFITIQVQKISLPGMGVDGEYQTLFDRVFGLELGSPVTMAGMQVGQVANLVLDGTRVRVTLRLKAPNQVPAGSLAELRSESMLGGAQVNIIPGGEPEFLAPGSQVPSREGRSGLGAIDQRLDFFSQRVTETLEGIDESRVVITDKLGKALDTIQEVVDPLREVSQAVANASGTLGRLVFSPDLARSIETTVANVEKISSDLRQSRGTLGKLITDDKIYTDVAAMVDRVNSGQGTLGKLIQDEDLYQGVKTGVAHFAQVSYKINEGQGAVARLVNDPVLAQNVSELVPNLNQAAASAGRLLGQAEQGQGTLGKLMTDDGLYLEAKETMRDFGDAAESLQDQTAITSFIGMAFSVFR